MRVGFPKRKNKKSNVNVNENVSFSTEKST